MDYLVYVTHDAENLQFYLWMVDYFRRYSNAPKAETSLSPKWNFDETPPTSAGIFSEKVCREIDCNDSDDISDASTLGDRQPYHRVREDLWKTSDPANWSKRSSHAAQPFRREINRIVAHYIISGSPRELNLSHQDRAELLNALQHTTHPSAFSNVKVLLDTNLRYRAHPNFIRWSICNGNPPWTFCLIVFATMNITIGFMIVISLTLSSHSRWLRLVAAAEWWFGFTNLFAASQGLCILLHRLSMRSIRPWEREKHRHGPDHLSDDVEASFGGGNIRYSETKSQWPMKMEVFGPSNNYLKEGWIEKDRREPTWRKVFAHKVIVQDRGLRIMQNKIIWCAEAWAFLITVALSAGFVALPKGNFY